MITFVIALVCLVLGYFVYGTFVEKVFGADANCKTPCYTLNDGADYVPMPTWKVFMIQFLNIAGTGPIFGAIMGAKFGPAAYLWIVLGCIFAGATHDYLSGMLSIRNGGANLPELIGKYLGSVSKQVMLVFSVFLLLMVGAVFVYSPASLMQKLCMDTIPSAEFLSSNTFWIILIFIYYIIATMMPIDKIIGKIYPLFAFSLLFMAVALMVMLFVKQPQIPELWEGVGEASLSTKSIFPCLFITIACGAISGFHATQSPLMARCIKNEKLARPVFYGSMITEGLVALIWATVAMYFFYNEPTPGYVEMGGEDVLSKAPGIVNLVCNSWLGVFGSILAILGVVAAPITSGDTALRSARLIIADFIHLEQKSIRKRLYVCIPMFAAVIALLVWQMENPQGFDVIWSLFGWSNQTLSVFTLWAITVYLAQQRKCYWITLLPALFMTVVCTTYILIAPEGFGLSFTTGFAGGLTLMALFAAIFLKYKNTIK
ncbi:MAG: carbon starvation protein A [Bacteroidaceae bacterium]|nr:carbon starvation protein A [Bacteroidaceae bacterium]